MYICICISVCIYIYHVFATNMITCLQLITDIESVSNRNFGRKANDDQRYDMELIINGCACFLFFFFLPRRIGMHQSHAKPFQIKCMVFIGVHA